MKEAGIAPYDGSRDRRNDPKISILKERILPSRSDFETPETVSASEGYFRKAASFVRGGPIDDDLASDEFEVVIYKTDLTFEI